MALNLNIYIYVHISIHIERNQFCMISNFFKCDGVRVSKLNISYGMVVWYQFYLIFLVNHDKLEICYSMHTEERKWLKVQIILTNCQYIEKSTRIKCSDFNLTCQIVIYHPVTSGNCSNVFSLVSLSCSDTLVIVLK